MHMLGRKTFLCLNITSCNAWCDMIRSEGRNIQAHPTASTLPSFHTLGKDQRLDKPSKQYTGNHRSVPGILRVVSCFACVSGTALLEVRSPGHWLRTGLVFAFNFTSPVPPTDFMTSKQATHKPSQYSLLCACC